MEKIKIEFKTETGKKIEITCEHAKNIFQKAKGLMNRKELPEKEGMFFSFYVPWIKFFWMKNVEIPLDIIFINSKKKIMKIYEAPVENGPVYKNYSSRGFCKYVVETNMGFCKKNGIKVDDEINILK